MKLLKFLKINKQQEEEKTSKKIIRNTAWVYAGFIFNTLIGIALLPFIISHLGKDAYGVFAIVSVVIGYTSLLDFGIGTTLVKFISEYNVKKDYEKINKIISTAFILYFILAFIGCAVILLFTDYFVTSLFNIPENLMDVTRMVFAVTAVTFMFNFIFGVFGNVITGLQRFDISTKIQIIMKAVSAIAIVLVLYLGYGLLEFVIVSALLGVTGIIINIIIAKRLMPEISLIPRYFDFHYVRVITSFSFAIFIVSISTVTTLNIDKLLIGIFLPIEEVTIYAVGATLALVIWEIPSKIIQIFIPTSSEFEAKKDKESIKKLILNGMKFEILISIIFVIFCIIFSKEIFLYWMGPEFEKSAIIFNILMLGFFANNMAQPVGSVSMGTGKTHLIVPYSVISIILNVPISIFFIQKWGVIGAALGTSVVMIFVWLLFTIHSCKLFNIKAHEILKEFSKIILIVVFLSLLLYLLHNSFPPGTLYELMLSFVMFSLVYASLIFIFIMTKKDKDRLWQYVFNSLKP